MISGVILFLGSAVPAPADDVHLDDVIIEGSLAVGGDAVDGETFGDDTIRLKENNLRIHFDDTSVSALFPKNDWRILINDAVNGGDEFFAIEDSTAATVPFRIMAGAGADVLTVESGGQVGILTDTPDAALHVNLTHDSNEPADSVLIGPDTLTPAGALLQVHGPVYLSKEGVADLTLDDADGVSLYVEGGALFSRNIEIGSSREFKEAIRDLGRDEALQTIRHLQPVEYRYIGDRETQLGFIAEEVPDLVATESRKSLSPMDFVAVLTRVVQDQSSRLEAQEDEFQRLRRTVDRLLAGEREAEAQENSKPDVPVDLGD